MKILIKLRIIVLVFLIGPLLFGCDTQSTPSAITTSPTRIATTKHPNPTIPSTSPPINNASRSTSTPTSTPTATNVSTRTPTPAPSPSTTSTKKIPQLRPVSNPGPKWSSILDLVNNFDGFYIVAFSPDGKYFSAIDSYDDYSKVYLWEVDKNELKWVVDFSQSLSPSGLVFSPDNKMLGIGTGHEQDIFVLDVADGTQMHHFKVRAQSTDLTFSPDSTLLAHGSFVPGGVSIWNLEDEILLEIGRGISIDFMPPTQDVVLVVNIDLKSPNDPSAVYLINLETDNKDFLFQGSHYAFGVASSPDGQYIAADVFDEHGVGNIKLIDVVNDEEILLEGVVEKDELLPVTQLLFSNNGLLAALQGDLKIWNMDGQLIASLENSQEISGFLITPDSTHLITYGRINSPVEIWELPSP